MRKNRRIFSHTSSGPNAPDQLMRWHRKREIFKENSETVKTDEKSNATCAQRQNIPSNTDRIEIETSPQRHKKSYK